MGRNKWPYARGHHQREGIDRPHRAMVVVVIELRSCMVLLRYRQAIEMRVNQAGVIVIRPETGVNVLERRETKPSAVPHTYAARRNDAFMKSLHQKGPVASSGAAVEGAINGV